MVLSSVKETETILKETRKGVPELRGPASGCYQRLFIQPPSPVLANIHSILASESRCACLYEYTHDVGLPTQFLLSGGPEVQPIAGSIPVNCVRRSTRVGVNSGIEWELSSIPDSIPGIGLGIGIEKKGIGIELVLTKNARN